MKRKNILIIVIVFILIVLLIGIPMYYFFNMESMYRKEKFEEKKDSFIVLAEFFNELYGEYPVEIITIRVDIEQDKYIFKISDGNEIESIEVQPNMVSCVEDVIEAFGHYGWNKTIVSEEAVRFSNEGNWYAFIYANDGEKPEYMNFATEPFEIKSKYLGDSCYFVESK